MKILATKIALTVAASALLFSESMAQHSDVPLDLDNQVSPTKIVTEFGVFEAEFELPELTPHTTNEPGFEVEEDEGAALIPNEAVTFNIVSLGTGIDQNYAYWDGTGSVSFGALPADHYLKVLDSGFSQVAVASGADLGVAGFAIDTTDAEGGLHEHLVFRAADNGNLDFTGAEPDAGVYLLGLTFDQPSLSETSDPIYIAFGAGVGEETVELAVDWVADSFGVTAPPEVPEPSTALLMILAVTLIGSQRKTRIVA